MASRAWSSWKRLAGTILVLTAALPSLPVAAAQVPAIMLGSEELPELWGDDTVTYHPAYPMGKDHDYLAINRSWFAVDPTETRLQTHLRVVSTERLEANRQNGNIQCGVNAALVDPSGSNPNPGRIHWGVSSTVGSPGFGGSAYISSGNSVGQTIQVIDSTFDLVIGTPGYYVWTVSRDTVMRYTWHLMNASASCIEDFGYFTPLINQDDASSKSDFSIRENRRVAAPDGALDPVERFERENETAIPPPLTSGESGEGTDAPALVALIVTVVACAIVWRRRAS